MIMNLQDQAEEFRSAYDVQNSPDNTAMQLRLINEEFREFYSAHMDLANGADEKVPNQNAASALKELADLVYVCFQYAENLEWDLQTAKERVHKSNMFKLGADGKPVRRIDGKILKGPDYKPPYLNDLCNPI